MTRSSRLAALAVAACALAVPAAAHAQDTLVTTGSPPFPFSQNKQNEPAVAVDPHNTAVRAAGSNDEIDMEACNAGDPTTCPFTPGVGVSGVYFSRNGEAWQQPTYSGLTGRGCLGPAPCTPQRGPIGTLPNYYEAGLVSDGDPALVFGPRPGANGRFAWTNGSRLYYANLASNVSANRSDAAFKGAEAIYASYTDHTDGTVPTQAEWSTPRPVSRQSSALFSDKEEIWADNASSSPYFGRVYICNVAFRGNGKGGGEPVLFHRSTDGGNTWDQKQISSATNNAQTGGRQGCAIRTDSRGTIYVFWVGTDIHTRGTVFFESRSFNGGQTFEQPRVAARITDAGIYDPAQGRVSFDGIAGARTGTFPSVDIANGAPTGFDATNEIVIVGTDGPTPSDTHPGPNERVQVTTSTNGGNSFTTSPVSGSPASDRPDFPAVAIAPNGTEVYLTYDNFLQPWQSTTANPRYVMGVVRVAPVGSGGAIGSWQDRHRAPAGDARGSSSNGLTAEFLGDYNYVFATRSNATATWNDTRNADDCAAVDAYRQAYVTAVENGQAQPADEDNPNDYDVPTQGGGAPSPPAVQAECAQPPNRFGNSDIWGGVYTPLP